MLAQGWSHSIERAEIQRGKLCQCLSNPARGGTILSSRYKYSGSHRKTLYYGGQEELPRVLFTLDETDCNTNIGQVFICKVEIIEVSTS